MGCDLCGCWLSVLGPVLLGPGPGFAFRSFCFLALVLLVGLSVFLSWPVFLSALFHAGSGLMDGGVGFYGRCRRGCR